jgi:hypothetical protein
MNLPPAISKVLKDYQRQPTTQLLRALQCGAAEWGYPGTVDLSDVGTGKSYMDTAAALATGRQPVVLCPVASITQWREVFALFGATPRHVDSYEAIRGGWRPEIGRFNPASKRFVWKDANNIVLILDESHKVKGQDTLTTTTVGGAIYDQIPIIAASATMATSPVDMRIAGRITGLHTGGRDWLRFLDHMHATYDDVEDRWKWDAKQHMGLLENIHHILIPQRGCRVRKADMGEQPGTTIRVLPFADIEEAAEIEKAWRELDQKVKWMERNHYPRDQITNYRRGQRMKIWKQSELALVPRICEAVKKCLDEGKSVVVFFNFTECRLLAAKLLKSTAGIYGGQSKPQREKYKQEFQANRLHLLLCNIGAAGASLSLHDTTGQRARETFIFPTDNPVKMGQAPGRVDRQGGKTHSLQWIPCIAGGFSQRMVESTARKLLALDAFNNGGQPKLTS